MYDLQLFVSHRFFFLAEEQEIDIVLFRFHYTFSRPYVLEDLSKNPLVLARRLLQGPRTR